MTRRAGFTLLELLLVMVVLAIIAGLGLGALSGLDLERRQTPGLVRNTLRSVQNTALARRVAVRVRCERDPSAPADALVPEVLSPIGTWHFEGGDPARLVGAFDRDGELLGGGRLIEEGFLGQGLSFTGEPTRSYAALALPADPELLRMGFALDFALRLDVDGRFRVLRVGTVAGVDTLGNGGLRGWFTPVLDADDGSGIESRGAHVTVSAPPAGAGAAAAGPLVVGRWARVRLEYDRTRLRLSIDGVVLAEAEADTPVWDVDGQLVISDARSKLEGTIDRVVLSVLDEAKPVRLAEGVRFVDPTPAAIAFAAGGGLDRKRHSGPLEVVLAYADGARDRMRVGIYGTVEEVVEE